MSKELDALEIIKEKKVDVPYIIENPEEKDMSDRLNKIAIGTNTYELEDIDRDSFQRVGRKSLVGGQLQQSVEMLAVAVHAARGNQAHEMQGTAICLGSTGYAQESLVLEEIPVLDSLGNTGESLIDNPACTDIGMAYLGVAHLTVRQAYELAGSLNMGIRELLLQTINNRSLRNLNGIVRVSSVAVAVAIHDNQCYWSIF